MASGASLLKPLFDVIFRRPRAKKPEAPAPAATFSRGADPWPCFNCGVDMRRIAEAAYCCGNPHCAPRPGSP